MRMLDVNSGESTLTPDVRSSIANRKNERKEASVVDDLVSDFGFLYVINMLTAVQNLSDDSILQVCECNGERLPWVHETNVFC